MLCVVQKQFKGNGEMWERDQLVDASIFRNGPTLINQRYLRPATPDEINSVYEKPNEAPRPRSRMRARLAKRS